MRIFGLDITRCSKVDRREEQVFIKTVTDVYDILCSFMAYIDKTIIDHSNEPEIIQTTYEFSETMTKLLMIYDDNKFSVPITSVGIIQKLQQIRMHIAQVQQLVSMHYKVLQRNAQMQQKLDNEELDDSTTIKYQEVIDQFDHAETVYEESVVSALRLLFADINTTIPIIQYDVMKVMFGVDIVRSYYHNQHVYRSARKWHSEYKFKVINECDIDTKPNKT